MTVTTPIARVSGATARAATQAVQVVRTEAPGWLGGLAAGVQGALLSFGLVLIPLWVVAAATTDESVTWGDATGVAARLWLLGFGVPWAVGGVPISLIPLGIPALTALMLVQLARRFASATWGAGIMTVLAFAGAVSLVAALAWSGAPDQGDRVIRAALVGVALAAPAVAWGLVRQHGAVMPWLAHVPNWVRVGTRFTVAAPAVLALLASVAAAGVGLAHRHAIAESATALGPDTVSGIAFGFLETLYAPTVIVWIIAWLSGAGFTLAGVHHVPGAAADAPLSVPLLGTLPVGGGIAAWAPWIVVAAGAALSLSLRTRLGSGWRAFAGIGVGAVGAGVLVGLASRVATGAMGPDLYSAVGPSPLATGALVGAELAGGAVLAAALWHAVGVLAGGQTTRIRTRQAPPGAGRDASEARGPSGPTAGRSRSDHARPDDNRPDTGPPAAE